MYLKSYFIRVAKNVLIKFPKRVVRFFEFLSEYFRFKSKNNSRFNIDFKNIYPCLNDKINSTPFDQHYIYHPAWAARILATTKPDFHADFSSILSFSTVISAFIPVKFYDYRPAQLNLLNFESGFADLTQLPFEDNLFPSVSCMHTIEHVGLGRYGDTLDANGDIKAIIELKRITKPDGDILFVTPVGKQKIEFNAHRIYSFESVIELFFDCRLINFSLIPDAGGLINNADPKLVEQQNYGCGCFWFKKI